MQTASKFFKVGSRIIAIARVDEVHVLADGTAKIRLHCDGTHDRCAPFDISVPPEAWTKIKALFGEGGE